MLVADLIAYHDQTARRVGEVTASALRYHSRPGLHRYFKGQREPTAVEQELLDAIPPTGIADRAWSSALIYGDAARRYFGRTAAKQQALISLCHRRLILVLNFHTADVFCKPHDAEEIVRRYRLAGERPRHYETGAEIQ